MNKFSSQKEPKMVSNSSSNEDFSFPVMSNPLSNFMVSSSSSLSSSALWRISSSRVFHHGEEEDEEEDDYDRRMEIRSMYEEGFSPSRREFECASFQGEGLEMEERMDYLWEDFNEHEKEVIRSDSRIPNSEICLFPRSSRRPSSSNSGGGMMVIGKFLRGLVSIRKSAKGKIMKGRL